MKPDVLPLAVNLDPLLILHHPLAHHFAKKADNLLKVFPLLHMQTYLAVKAILTGVQNFGIQPIAPQMHPRITRFAVYDGI